MAWYWQAIILVLALIILYLVVCAYSMCMGAAQEDRREELMDSENKS